LDDFSGGGPAEGVDVWENPGLRLHDYTGTCGIINGWGLLPCPRGDGKVEIAKVSSKGQVVIPSSVRKMLGIKTNDRFLVFGSDDTIVFKKISVPAIEKTFEEITAPLAKRAKELGITQEKVDKVIHGARK
jgi:AbrB family looped-hinge helix DNA binding protein